MQGDEQAPRTRNHANSVELTEAEVLSVESTVRPQTEQRSAEKRPSTNQSKPESQSPDVRFDPISLNA